MRGIIEKIIKLAIFAPSGDNSQPWRFEVHKNKIYIFNLADRDIPFYNYEQKGSYVAHGGVIENIVIAASTEGFQAGVEYFPEENSEDLVAIVELEKTGTVQPDPLCDFIKKRVTNRKPYKKISISEEDRKTLLNSADEVGGGQIILIEDKKQKSILGKASSVNEKTVLITKQLHRVFFDHLVWTKEEELEKRAGLFVKTLELPAPQQVAFKWASHWWFVNFANKFGLYKMIARDGAKLIASSPFLISTVMNNNTKESFVLSGRLMQRVCLKLTQMGHSTHPVTGVLFLYQRVLGKDTKGLSSKQVKDIDEAYKKIAEICGVDNDGLVTLLLRTGDGGSPSDISSRLEPKIDFFDN